jgi:PhnB protein
MAQANVKPIPKGYAVLIPAIRMRNAAAAIDWYKKIFGATVRMNMTHPQGKVMHAELMFGDSCLMLSDEFPEWGCLSPETVGGVASSLHLYVPDVDATYSKAVAAGATGLMPPQDMFYGDRSGKIKDPFGHEWALATHVEDVSDEETKRRAAKMFGG